MRLANVIICALASAFTVLQAPAKAWTAAAGLVPEAQFLPPAGAFAARQPFHGTLVLSETRMATNPAVLHTTLPLKQNPQLFPAARLTFFSDRGDLVPATQDVQRVGSRRHGKSYWDIIVQPGVTWSQRGEDGWSHASFPFALVNSLENDTHNGIATFRYRASEISAIHFQISAQTAPFVVDTVFTAFGDIPVHFEPALLDQRSIRAYRAYLSNRVPMASWSDLTKKLGRPAPDVDADIDPSELIVDGVDYQGTFYVHKCAGAAGPLAWCDRRRFGVWSATKALVNATALLRLAQKYGPTVFDARIADYVPEVAASPKWREVRFGDAIGMATGIGNGNANTEIDAIFSGSLDASYFPWYYSRSAHEKLVALVKDGNVYPWGPGRVARYRDQDMFTIGVAMDRFVKKREGAHASIWSMLLDEVYRPIGIEAAPMNKTIEPDGSMGLPLMAFGYYPTIGDMVRIARLYQAHGTWHGKQILFGPRIVEILDREHIHGLPAGRTGDGREIDYFNAFWRQPYKVGHSCNDYIAEMRGFGGVIVALIPGGVNAIRVARITKGEPDGAGLIPLAILGSVCSISERLIK